MPAGDGKSRAGRVPDGELDGAPHERGCHCVCADAYEKNKKILFIIYSVSGIFPPAIFIVPFAIIFDPFPGVSFSFFSVGRVRAILFSTGG
jgi:hypothetical protein